MKPGSYSLTLGLTGTVVLFHVINPRERTVIAKGQLLPGSSGLVHEGTQGDSLLFIGSTAILGSPDGLSVMSTSMGHVTGGSSTCSPLICPSCHQCHHLHASYIRIWKGVLRRQPYSYIPIEPAPGGCSSGAALCPLTLFLSDCWDGGEGPTNTASDSSDTC